MRFTVDIFLSGNPPFAIPTNYRRNIASLIKEALNRENPELYNWLYGTNIGKPFTFCVHIPFAEHVKEKTNSFLKFDGHPIKLTVSSSDDALLINIYNALLNISGKYSPFENCRGVMGNVIMKNFHLQKSPVFSDTEYMFRLMSPMIVRNMNYKSEGNKNSKGTSYLTIDDKDFTDNLFHSVMHQCKEFISSDFVMNKEDFVFTPVGCKTIKVFHYNEAIPAVTGMFTLFAMPDVLKLIFNAGIGARRSQGFGMVEVK